MCWLKQMWVPSKGVTNIHLNSISYLTIWCCLECWRTESVCTRFSSIVRTDKGRNMATRKWLLFELALSSAYRYLSWRYVMSLIEYCPHQPFWSSVKLLFVKEITHLVLNLDKVFRALISGTCDLNRTESRKLSVESNRVRQTCSTNEIKTLK